MTKEKKIFQPVRSSGVFLIYNRLLDSGLISFPLTQESRNKVEALISSINGQYFSTDVYHSRYEKAVAHLYFLVKEHPFLDGNKRTASLVFEIVCYMNELTPDYADFGLDSLVVFIEKSKSEDHRKTIKIIALVLFGEKIFNEAVGTNFNK